MRILIVDDEPAVRFALAEVLDDDGHEVRAAEHAPAALALLDDAPADLIISDLSMPAMSGLELLEEVRQRYPDALFVLITARGDERVAVRALKLGALDYIPKPYDNDELRAVVRRAQELLALRTENARLRAELATGYQGLIGASPAMRELYRLLRRIAPTDVTVLITGESGTGKELVAQALHQESPRRSRPFIALNCAALPADLVESQLFGHLRGAFTGADRDQIGVFEAAHGGTLFLDEIGELAQPAQAKLLRALEARRITRLGTTRDTPFDVRVLAATNTSLQAAVQAGRFREDLYFRLAVVHLDLPPLRARRDDIAPLAAHFLATFTERYQTGPRSLTDAARRALLAYDWPGNVRELRNTIERAVVLAPNHAIDLADLPYTLSGASTPLRPAEAALAELPYRQARRQALASFEQAFLTAALEQHGGNVSATARTLGIHRQSLQKLLRRWSIGPESE